MPALNTYGAIRLMIRLKDFFDPNIFNYFIILI